MEENKSKKFEVTTNPLKNKFGKIEFNSETEEKIKKISHLSPFKKSLIVSSMVKFYNHHIWDGKGEPSKSINFGRFNKIIELLKVNEEQHKEFLYQYKQKDKLFQNQSDDLIAIFDIVLPKNMDDYDTEQRAMTLVEATNGAYLKLFGSYVKYSPSTLKVGDLALLGALDAGSLGANPRDSIKKVQSNNPNVINEMFMVLLSSLKKE